MIISLPQNNCSAPSLWQDLFEKFSMIWTVTWAKAAGSVPGAAAACAGAGCCAVCVGPVSSCRCVWRFYFLDKKAECVGECSNMHLRAKHSCNWPQIFAVFLDELSFEPKWWQRDIEEVENHLQHYIPAIPLALLGFLHFIFYWTIAIDLRWGKPCVFALCALGATWQDQCLCGCIQKPYGSLCPWAEIIWGLYWITNSNPKHTVLYATHLGQTRITR